MAELRTFWTAAIERINALRSGSVLAVLDAGLLSDPASVSRP
ncbi:hypothetical protein [Catellatospora paridis]|nr:hypothetical protein [Catellatospora paridis]